MIAEKTFPSVFESLRGKFALGKNDYGRLKAFYCGGALFPDTGNYPGGNKKISDLSHNLRTWDLADEMISLSKNVEEMFFSYGWALHVVTDVIGHPQFTNLTHSEIVGLAEKFPNGVEAYDNPLEHKKTEFGASAYLLGLEENLFLWDISLAFPFEKNKESVSSIVEESFRRVYAISLTREDLVKGEAGLKKEIKRIPVVMKILGSVRGRWEDFLEKALGFFLRYTFVALYVPLLSKRNNQGAIAVLKPFRIDSNQANRLMEVNTKIIEKFGMELSNDFASMSNQNLDTGLYPSSGRSRHADSLIREFEDRNMEEEFKIICGTDHKYLFEKWQCFRKAFFREK